MTDSPTRDAVVVGGGPAGLSAALWLGRYRRDVLVLDHDRPRNEAAWAVHGFPGVQDPRPTELRGRFRDQAIAAGARIERCRVTGVGGSKGRFVVETAEGEAVRARRVVLAYGRTDRVPDLPGLRERYGTAVFHCPDCDGPSVAGCDVGVLGHDRDAAMLALYLLTWARRTVLLTNGLAPELEPEAAAVLDRDGVQVRTEPVQRLEGEEGRLEAVVLPTATLPLQSLFFHWGSDPATQLARSAGCDCDAGGDLRIEPRTMETSVPGIYAAGDIIGRPHLVIAAAAEGVQAALALHRSLLPPEYEL